MRSGCLRHLGVWLSTLVFGVPVAGAEHITLREAIAQALAGNAGLLAARTDLELAEARIATARLRPNPVLNLAGDHLDVLGTRFNDVNGGGPAEIAGGIEFTLERGARRQRRVDVARESRAVVELQVRQAVRGLVFEVSNAFVNALLTRESIALARENLGFFREIVSINETRVKAGDIAEVELVRSRLAALQYETAVRQAEFRHRQAVVRLQTLIGRRPSPGLEVDGSLDPPDTAPVLDELRRQALEQRPDLLALRRDVHRAQAEVALQRASAKPSWTFGVDYRRHQQNARANAMTFTLGAPLPIFDRNQGEIARALGEHRQAELRLRHLETEIAGEVEVAWSQFTTARSLLDTIRGEMLRNARDVRSITEFAYRRGDSNLLALLDAQRAFNETMQAYMEARAEYSRSLYQLENVCGKEDLP